jgi:uncharacterized protein YndB with AHSA1/START domain
MNSNEPFVIERLYQAPVEKVWKALTDKNDMKKWYFDIAEFKPEVGFEFGFEGRNEDTVYHHRCKIIEVVQFKKLRYSWQYQGHVGYSVVTFELFDEGGKTRLKLTHEGIESFPSTPDFKKQNFVDGWNHIIGRSLPEFLENSAV